MRKRMLAAIAAAAFVFPAAASAVAWQPPPCHDPTKCPIEKPPPD